MKVIIHAGAHETDEDRLLKCLIDNRALLSSNGTCVPSPSSYRKPIRDFMHESEIGAINPDAHQAFLHGILGTESPDRLVLSNYGFFGTPKMCASPGQLYKAAEWRLQVFHQIFPQCEIELFMAARNPATLLPAIARSDSAGNVAARVRSIDPTTIYWSELFHRIRNSFSDMPMTVWCNEDTPLIWPDLVRAMAGLGPNVGFEGEFAMAQEIMTETGTARLDDYLASRPDLTESQKRRVTIAFLEKFADQDAIEEVVDFPGWTEELIDHLSTLYDDDIEEIERIPRVNVITP